MHPNRRDFLRLSGAAGAGLLGFRNLLGSTRVARGAAPVPEGPGSAVPLPGAGAPSPRRERGPQAARPKLRGIMVDAARLPASMRYYRRVIEFCASWKLNALHFRLTDDQGSVLRFASVPGLVTHPDAFTGEQLHDLAEYGRQHGVEVIPEVESFGHTGYITRSARYAHLLDSTPASTEFSGVIPVDPETLDLFRAMYREVASIFPAIRFHGGCDEVNWGGSAMSRRALQTRTRSQIWAAYLNSLNQICTSLGKEFIVWGDYVLHKEPGILGLLDQNIIVMDWLYEETDPLAINRSRLQVRAHGARGIGAPALLDSEWGPRSGTQQLRNIDAFAYAYLQTPDPGSLGVILTNWVPTRFLQDSIWDGFAYAAVAFADGPKAARASGFRRFVEKHYGAEWNETWGELFEAIYAEAPRKGRRNGPASGELLLPAAWSTDEELVAACRAAPLAPHPFTRLRSQLVRVQPLVRRHWSDFQGFALSMAYLEGLFWRQDVVRNAARNGAGKRPLDQPAAAALIRSIAARDRSLAEALSQDWDKGRPADAPEKTGPVFGFPSKFQVVSQWGRAAAYSGSLADRPERFHQLLATARS